MNKNVAVRHVLVSDVNDIIGFYTHKNELDIRVKTTNKKRANGLVIPFSNEIIIDKDGKDYVLTVSLVFFCGYSFCGDSYSLTYLILRLNDEHAKMLDIDGFDKENGSDYLFGLFKSLGLYDKIKAFCKKEEHIGMGYPHFVDFCNAVKDADKIFLYLTEIK